MKKTLIKFAVLAVIFVITIIVSSKILNKDQDNITMDLEGATFPVVTMVRGDFLYNELHGYARKQEYAFSSENVTVLSENRSAGFHIDTYGESIKAIDIEVRGYGDGRLIEQSSVTDYTSTDWEINGFIYLKDLLDVDTLYSLEIALTLEDDRQIYFYTDALWSDGMEVDEKISFVQNFHDKLFNKDNATEIKKYLETNSLLNDNKTFAKVDIHSNIKQVMYGDLELDQLEEPKISVKEISPLMAEIILDYYAYEKDEEEYSYYRLKEYFRIRKGTERMLLIDYERRMEQIPDEKKLCVNDKIVLGITDKNISFMESEDGNTVAFTSAGKLYSYQASDNKLTRVFAFSGREGFDDRAEYDAHKIKIFDIEESGTIQFAVYGYMNSGRHEGEVGIEIYRFDGKLNTIEELLYIPYDGVYGVLEAELDTLLYLNRDNRLYLTFENLVYCINLEDRTATIRSDIENDDTLTASKDHRILVSTKDSEENGFSKSIILTNLKNEADFEIKAGIGDAIKPLGFAGNDIIYGVAHIGDIKEGNSGKTFFPMYQIVICDELGNQIKTYEYEGYYVTGIEIGEGQIILDRVMIDANGRINETKPDYITTRSQEMSANVTDATAIVEKYETYVQLQLPKAVNTSKFRVVIPKEIVYEGGRNLIIDKQIISRYYVCDAYGLAKIYNLEANAVTKAYENAGWVKDNNGRLLWKRTTRQAKNQIMAITSEQSTDEKSSLSVCIDALLKNEGIIRNSNYLLSQGESVLEILENNLEGMKVLNLEDCPIDSILYYVNKDIPVLVLTGDDSALLIVGYNDTNSYLVVLNPDSNSLDKISLDDATVLFERSGNFFITYIKGGN